MPTMGNVILAGTPGVAGRAARARFFGRRFGADFSFMILFSAPAESDWAQRAVRLVQLDTSLDRNGFNLLAEGKGLNSKGPRSPAFRLLPSRVSVESHDDINSPSRVRESRPHPTLRTYLTTLSGSSNEIILELPPFVYGVNTPWQKTTGQRNFPK
jgi:hypothetical protein